VTAVSGRPKPEVCPYRGDRSECSFPRSAAAISSVAAGRGSNINPSDWVRTPEPSPPPPFVVVDLEQPLLFTSFMICSGVLCDFPRCARGCRFRFHLAWWYRL